LVRALGDRLPAPKTAKDKINPVRAYAREQRDAIAAYDPGVRHGDAESVHKMRVGTRRLRSTLKTFKRSFAPELAQRVGPELRWLARQLGEVRDGQVLSHKLLAAVEREGAEFAPVAERIGEHLDAKVARGREALAEDLDSRRYLNLLDAIDELVDAPDIVERDPLRRARKALRKADDLLDTAITDGVDAELHEARKSYKRARYAVEVFEPSVGKPATKLTKALTNLQDVLARPPGLGGRPRDPARPCWLSRRQLPVRDPLRPPGAGRPGHVRRPATGREGGRETQAALMAGLSVASMRVR
jgi:CHAD domain-containing protein